MEPNKHQSCGDMVGVDTKSVVQAFSRERGNLLPILHALQDNIGYLSCEAMEEVADWLSMPTSEVYGTATFYTLFATEPRGKYIVRICNSTPCHIEGSKAIRGAIEQTLGIQPGGTTDDGLFSFEIVSCFGLCGVAPAIMVNDDVFGNLTPEMVPGILARYSEKGE